MKKGSWFAAMARWTSHVSGHAGAFLAALLTIVVWGATGPLFGYSDTWQLVINTGTTIITFLMVFAIQNTQNRDTAAIQLKLDELIRAVRGAHNEMLDLEEMEEDELEATRAHFAQLASRARDHQDRKRKQKHSGHRRSTPTNTPGESQDS